MDDNYLRLVTTLPCGCRVDRTISTAPGQQVDIQTSAQILEFFVRKHKCEGAENAS
jgi:hypothetical protein